jgi:hypothetical protein
LRHSKLAGELTRLAAEPDLREKADGPFDDQFLPRFPRKPHARQLSLVADRFDVGP